MWGLTIHTVAMFSFATICGAMNLSLMSISYIDNREFPGVDAALAPGPAGYSALIYSQAIKVVPNIMFMLNNWLADGLLVHSLFNNTEVSNAGRSYSCTAAMSYTL